DEAEAERRDQQAHGVRPSSLQTLQTVFALDTARVTQILGLLGRQLLDLDLAALRVVLDQDVARLRVVVLVEVVLTPGADVAYRLARMEGVESFFIGVHVGRAGRAVRDLLDLRV